MLDKSEALVFTARPTVAELKADAGGADISIKTDHLYRKPVHRLALNVLLYYARDTLLENERHSMPADDLMRLLGIEAGNKVNLKKTLEELMDMKVVYNALAKDRNKSDWGIFHVLSEVRIVGDTCYYAFPPTLRERLANPTVQARFNVLMQNRFNHKHSITLYEMCKVYAMDGITPWFEIDAFKRCFDIIEGMTTFEYGYFKRDVLDKTIDDINTFSDLRIGPDFETKGRKVLRIRFTVAELAPLANAIANPPPNLELINLLMSYGLYEKTAREFVIELPEEQIRAILAYVDRQLAAGFTAKNKGNFTKHCLENRIVSLMEDVGMMVSAPKTSIEEDETARQAVVADAKLKASFNAYRTTRLDKILTTKSINEVQALKDQFLAGKISQAVKRMVEEAIRKKEDPFQAPGLVSVFKKFLCEQLLTEPHERDFEAFKTYLQKQLGAEAI